MINSLLAIPVRITEFAKEHTFWFIIIVTLILSCFFPIPYLHDFMIEIIEFIKSLELISFEK